MVHRFSVIGNQRKSSDLFWKELTENREQDRNKRGFFRPNAYVRNGSGAAVEDQPNLGQLFLTATAFFCFRNAIFMRLESFPAAANPRSSFNSFVGGF